MSLLLVLKVPLLLNCVEVWLGKAPGLVQLPVFRPQLPILQWIELPPAGSGRLRGTLVDCFVVHIYLQCKRLLAPPLSAIVH